LCDILRRVNSHFSGDTYVTRPDAPTSLLNRLTFGWRWAFYLEYFTEVLGARASAVRGKYDDAEWSESSFRVLSIIEHNRGRFQVEGLQNLRDAASGAPYVFISNHMSSLETQVLPTLIVPFMPVTFVVKRQLVEGPIFGPIMRSREPIAVGRKNAREDLDTVLSAGKELLGRGKSIIVFPQSTRTPAFRREEFNSLGVKLAARASVPVVPVAVKTDFWGDKGLFRGFGKVRPRLTIHIEFGRPIDVTGRGKEVHVAIMDFIEERQNRWQKEQIQ